MLEFDVAWSHFDVAWGHFDVAWQKLWHKNDVFDEILGCAGHLTLPKKKWAPVAVKIFYKYGGCNPCPTRPPHIGDTLMCELSTQFPGDLQMRRTRSNPR